MKKQVVGIVALVLLAACASSGVQVSQEQAQGFQAGKSSYTEVVAALGPPTTTSISSNGQKIVVYSYASVQSRPASFIPIIGPLVGGADVKSSAVAFVFDKADILVSYNSTQSNAGSTSH